MSISSNSLGECAPRPESSGTVAVSLSESETIAPPSSVHGKEQDPSRDQNIGQESQHGTDRTPIDAMNIGKNKMVFRMDMVEEERFQTPIPKSMVMCKELNKMHNKAKQLTKKTKPRITAGWDFILASWEPTG